MDHKLRKQFSILNTEINGKPLVYLDNAATSQKPQAVLDAINTYYNSQNANIHRGIHTLSNTATNLWEEAHKTVAQFINAESMEEIVFTRNTTEGLNLIAQTYGRQNLKKGDVIVLTEMEHHSNIVPWQVLAREKGLKLEWIPLLKDYSLDYEYLDFIVRKYNEKIKIISFSLLSNVLGISPEYQKVYDVAKKVDAKIVVDAAQAIVHQKVDVQDLDCDFLVFSGHKIYGPTGSGVMYGKKELLESMEPWMGGGEMISSVSKTSSEWNELPWKFEAGTPNICSGIALGAAIKWFKEEVGYRYVEEHEMKLMKKALELMKDIKEVTIFGPTDFEKRKSVVAFTVEGIHPHDIASFMDENGVAIRAGYHCAEPLHREFDMGPTARISFAIYNTEEEIEIFIKALKSIIQQFK